MMVTFGFGQNFTILLDDQWIAPHIDEIDKVDGLKQQKCKKKKSTLFHLKLTLNEQKNRKKNA